MVLGLQYGYSTEQSKSILIVKPAGVEQTKELVELDYFNVTSGLRYLGGITGEKGAQTEWIKTKIEKWAEGASDIACSNTPTGNICCV